MASNGNTDYLVGEQGADILTSGSGNDFIWHAFTCGDQLEGCQTSSDNSKDYLDCGPGNDEAWINVSVDHDVAIN
jgi:hypothetical protein